MRISPELFGAYLVCPTKCWLKSKGDHGAGNAYAEWVQGQDEAYRAAGVERLRSAAIPEEQANSPPTDRLREAKRRLAFDVTVQNGNAESRLHAVERVPSEGRGKAAQFIPVRFIYRNKLTKEDRMLVAFDAMVLSESLGREVGLGKIIHGDDHATLKVKVPALTGKVRKAKEKFTALLSSTSPPDLILSRRCPECEYRDQCRQKAIEKDDLSLLSNMAENERNEFRAKGIFTVTQLSYTFRPRRRPKKLVGKREKYHHSLKGLALRERKIYVVGSPEFKPEGTQVYVDVEGLPDRDFYYLIGARVATPAGTSQYSFWADDQRLEKTIWDRFISLLAGLDNPTMIHYGGFEGVFLKRMAGRYSLPVDTPAIRQALGSTVNLLSRIFAHIYCPTFSNGLKDIAGFLGFKWSTQGASGPQSIVWRMAWEHSKDTALKECLVQYNAEDCQALEITAQMVARLGSQQPQPDQTGNAKENVVQVDTLKPPFASRWRVFSSPIGDLEFVNRAAHWDYQRDRIYVRSSKRVARARRKARNHPKTLWRVDKTIDCSGSNRCPDCRRKGLKKNPVRSTKRQEILFGRFGLKRRVIRYECQPYWCERCGKAFGLDEHFGTRGQPPRYGRSFVAYVFYQLIDLCLPIPKVTHHLARIFGIDLNSGVISSFKESLAAYYRETQEQILKRIIAGTLIHVDETHVTIKRRKAYVWVLTNVHEVAYIYSETREGEWLHQLLGEFQGVLVSDFFSVYDSFKCPQQRCLIHLVRDLNEELLRNPFDEEFRQMVAAFGGLLKTVVEEVDRRGLKKHFLHKHLAAVARFYRKAIDIEHQSPAAIACQERFRKNRNRLFTFLNYDGVPWNNNNAEHAIKAFARLREFIESGTTEKGLKEYLTLLSICQTCKYQELDFLDFLLSGEMDIEVFAEKHGGRRRRERLDIVTSGSSPNAIPKVPNAPTPQ